MNGTKRFLELKGAMARIASDRNTKLSTVLQIDLASLASQTLACQCCAH